MPPDDERGEGESATHADQSRRAHKDAAAAEAAASLRRHYLENLERELAAAVSGAKADGVVTFPEVMRILGLATEYLSDDPDHARIQALVKQCQRLAPPLLTNSIGAHLKFIPAGTFTMGGQSEERTDQRPHRVRLTRPFYIGVHQVTNAQWKQVMDREPSGAKHPDCPVEDVTWEESVEFCRRLSSLPNERKAGRVYLLPTEAQWEYACRAGSTASFAFGDDEGLLGEHGWFEANSDGQSHPVGQKNPNRWGLHDMHGNVCEWCSDWYAEYPHATAGSNDCEDDPQGPPVGSDRVLRGGGWDNAAGWCRSAFRNATKPADHGPGLGLRLALGTAATSEPA